MKVPELDIPRRIDHAGIATMTIGVSSALLGISFGGNLGWLDPMVVVLLVVGAVFLVAFVLIERRAAEPIVPMYLFRNSVFTWSVIATCFMNMALMVMIIYTPVYAQGVLGVTPTTSGLMLIPMNVALFLVGMVVGNLISRTGRYKSYVVAGVVVVAVASLLMLRLGVHSSALEVTVYSGVFGVGTGMSFQIYTLVVQNAVQRRDLGPATSSLQFFRNVANTLGTAVAGTMMTTHLVAGIDTNMTPEARAQIPAGGLDPNVVLHHEALAALPEAIADVLRLSLAQSMHNVYVLLPWLSVVMLAATLAIRPIPLRDTLTSAEPGEGALEVAGRSVADPNAVVTTGARHLRAKERMMAAHLFLLAENAEKGDNEILQAAVAEFGDGGLDAGIRLLRAAGRTLLSADAEVIDENEAFAVELSERGKRRDMLSDDLTRRLYDIADRVSQRAAAGATPQEQPRTASVEGIDVAALQRAVSMLDTALVADIVSRRWLDEP